MTSKIALARQNAKKLLDEITANPNLENDMKLLPSNYNFEIAKTIWKIRTTESTKVALQFPEGLLLYSCVIADLLRKYTDCETIIMGDVTYGACCIDDYTAKELGCQLLVHYGHSCLVPIQETEGITMLYIFVDIRLNTQHFVDSIRHNFEHGKTIAMISTIQFVRALQDAQTALQSPDPVESANSDRTFTIVIPQCKPLSPGEVLGCTSPKLREGIDALVYLGDGRFHLESAMIANPSVPAYQYDPYAKVLTHEVYDFERMNKTRAKAIADAKDAKTYGLILGTLGRQGNPKIYHNLRRKLKAAGKRCVQVAMSEVFPDKLAQFTNVDCWVQVACPRLSIDWGSAFVKPLLSPYELAVALNAIEYSTTSYPMDFYANDSLGPWTNNNEEHRPAPRQRRRKPEGLETPSARGSSGSCGTSTVGSGCCQKDTSKGCCDK